MGKVQGTRDQGPASRVVVGSDSGRRVNPGGSLAAMDVNARGGRHHRGLAFTQLPAEAVRRAAAIITAGIATHGKNNWRRLGVDEHLDHAAEHLNRYMAGDDEEDHLGHALCRVLFACEVEVDQGRPDFAAEADGAVSDGLD